MGPADNDVSRSAHPSYYDNDMFVQPREVERFVTQTDLLASNVGLR